jgi:predicted aspartyl protease
LARFPWQLLPGLQPPYPSAFVELHGGGVWVQVSGLFDTGASLTTLRGSVEQPRLNLANRVCIPCYATDANGAVTPQKATVLRARLDGHEFDLPVVFSDGVPINLIGRAGLSDLWEVRHDPTNAVSHFDWLGPQPGTAPWADRWITYWQEMLNRKWDWPNWDSQGRPPVPMPPNLPAPLP